MSVARRFVLLVMAWRSVLVECILSGLASDEGEFPSVVLVKFNDSFYCGGSLLLPKYVVTSGVCGYRGEHIEGVGVRFKDLFAAGGEGELLDVDFITVHPDFHAGTVTTVNDVSLVRLRVSVDFDEFLTALPLYEGRPPVGATCWTAGWGMVNPSVLTMEDAGLPWPEHNTLRKSEQRVVPLSDCRRLLNVGPYPGSGTFPDPAVLPQFPALDDEEVCCRGAQPRQGPSLGDFGGPLVCSGRQAAVSTYSLFDRQTQFLYTVYTPLYRHVRWMKDVVGEMETPHVPPDDDGPMQRPLLPPVMSPQLPPGCMLEPPPLQAPPHLHRHLMEPYITHDSDNMAQYVEDKAPPLLSSLHLATPFVLVLLYS